MRVRFFGPFESMAERESEFSLDSPLTVGELIGLLSRRYPGMARYAGIRTDADLSAHLVFVRDGRLLRMSDVVADRDCLQILLPATGG
jgi:molybdopterin converting factor small subunit